ncbi:MAG: hypothetical protein AAF467_03425 [Actinomycetota bacterium]
MAEGRSRLGRIGPIILALLVGLVLGGVVAGLSGTTGPTAADAVGPDVGEIRVGANTAGPFDKVDGVGVGFAQSEEGAVAAATNLLLTLEQAGTTDRANAIAAYRILAAEGSSDYLAGEMGSAWDALHTTIQANGPIQPTLFLRTVPVGHAVTRYSPERATVEIWTLTLVAAAGMRQPLSTWETATVDVVWENDDWKVWSATSAPGPNPSPSDGIAVTPTELFLNDVETLEGYRYVSD